MAMTDPQRPDFAAIASQKNLDHVNELYGQAVGPDRAYWVVNSSLSVSGLPDTSDKYVKMLSEDVILKRIALNKSVAHAVRVLSYEGYWRPAMQLAVTYGGVPQSDIARFLRVMRSTVGRWINGESLPTASAAKRYGEMIANGIDTRSWPLEQMIHYDGQSPAPFYVAYRQPSITEVADLTRNHLEDVGSDNGDMLGND